MLGFFPDPYPDELLYSACARYKERTKYPNQLAAEQELFSGQNIHVAVDLPNRLGNLVANLPLFHTYTADRFIDDHTLFPFYAPFLPLERAQIIRKEMKGDGGNRAYERLAIKLSNVKTPSHLRFCPTCVDEDRHTFSEISETYWHRIHQVSGIEVCHRHEVHLEASEVTWPGKHRSMNLVSAERAVHNAGVRPLDLTSKQDSFLLAVAREATWLLNWRGRLPGKHTLRKTYYNLLLKRGYAYYNGRIRTTKFLNAFEEFYTPEFLERVHCPLGKQWNNWLLRLLWPNKVIAAQHPLHHILLILFLGCTAEEVLTSPYEYKPFGDGPWPCLNPASEHYGDLLVEECIITDGINHTTIGKPVGTFSCQCGFIYNRTKPDTTDEDRLRKDNVVCYGKVWEARLRELWLDDSLSLKEIANFLGIIQFSVKRHAMRLRLPRSRGYKGARPTGEKVYQQYSNFKEALPDAIQTRRGEWLATIEANPEVGRNELIALANYTYFLLRRYDREWLEEHMPPSRKPPPPPRKMDWESEDPKLAAAVEDAAMRIKQFFGRPTRASKENIIREVGHRSWIEQHLNKLPRTAKALAQYSETQENFIIRRVEWISKCYLEEGICATRPQIIRRAGTRTKAGMSARVQAAIDAAVTMLSKELSS